MTVEKTFVSAASQQLSIRVAADNCAYIFFNGQKLMDSRSPTYSAVGGWGAPLAGEYVVTVLRGSINTLTITAANAEIGNAPAGIFVSVKNKVSRATLLSSTQDSWCTVPTPPELQRACVF